MIIGSRSEDDPSAGYPTWLAPVARYMDLSSGTSRGRTIGRIVAGVALVVISMAAVLSALPAIAVTAVGLALIGGPVIFRLGRQLADERADRIRSQERADMAAHLHDSVLQTLAMIQRSGSQREMITLARAQERELRGWLFTERDVGEEPTQTLRDVLTEMIAKSEQRYQVVVNTVVVGDVGAGDAVLALVDACGEAVANAAKHSGVADVSIYVECEDATLTAFVRDEGSGFDASHVSEDRRGISHSICDRIERHGGTATVETGPGRGTEWQLQIPVQPWPVQPGPVQSGQESA